MIEDIVDPRRRDPDSAYTAGERELLDAWLDFHRMTLQLKCEGVTEADLTRRPVPTSTLSLQGLVRHMAEVERNWFRRVLLDPELPRIYGARREDREFEPIEAATWREDLATWQREVEQARNAARGMDLSRTGVREGKAVSLRWIYVHMIEEYARHNGHADLIRELIDGAVGW